jgi:CHAD domain-containing protein
MAAAREIEGLDCRAGALEGIRLVLGTRFSEMYDLRDAALGPEDVKGVHDMRVASRRLRSTLRDFRGFYDPKGLPKRRLKEVASALGDVRDQDVAIDALEEMRSQTDGAVAEGIELLVGERRAVRSAARTRLGPFIAGGALQELQQKFLSWLEHTGGGGDDRKGARRSLAPSKVLNFRHAGVEVIESRLLEVLELSDSLNHPFVSEPLHDLRIAAKRLRYALELFSPCWDGALKPAAREVSELQTALGDLRDCDTWIEDLGARLDRRRADSGSLGASLADPRVRPAAAWLLAHYTRERGEHFGQAFARWQQWEADGFLMRVRDVLRGAQAPHPQEPATEPDADAALPGIAES